MKTIQDISLEPDYNETSNQRQFRSDFAFHCRFIGNYLRRALKKMKFESINYNRIFISACHSSLEPNKLLDNTLRVSVLYDRSKYNDLTKEEVIDYYIKLYEEGILKASETHNVPIDFLLKQLNEFKNNGCKNEWEFKTKILKEIGIKATLSCKMTSDNFSLFLILSKKDEVIFNKEILNTLPDETIFHYKFKDIILENNEIKVIDKFDKPIYILDLTFTV